MRPKILLLQLYSDLQPSNAEPLSIQALASAIEKEFPNCRINLRCVGAYTASENDLWCTPSLSLSEDYDLIGISIPQGTLYLAFDVLDNISGFYSDANRPLIVLGHSLPTNIPEMFLDKYPWAIAVHGWGEDSLLALLKRNNEDHNLETVPGIYYVNSGQITSTPVNWSYQAYQPKRLSPNSFFARIETSRGCVHNTCTFCLRPIKGHYSKHNSTWHRFPLQQVLDNIEDLKSKGITEFTFADEDFFGSDLAITRALAQGILNIGGVQFSFSTLADDIYLDAAQDGDNEQRVEILKLLKKAGLTLMFCGVESLSNTQLKRYGKRASVNDIIASTNIIKHLDISLELGFILFDPFLSTDELIENVYNLEKTGLWKDMKSIFSFLNIYKNTPFEKWLQNEALITKFDPNMLTYHWSFADKQVARVAEFCKSWRNEFHSIYSALRNVSRTNLLSEYAKEYLVSFRQQDLIFLKCLIENIEKPKLFASIWDDFVSKRMGLLYSLRNSLNQIHPKSTADLLLLKTLQKTIHDHQS